MNKIKLKIIYVNMCIMFSSPEMNFRILVENLH